MGNIILTDRSRIVARQECPRLRYWGYDYAGRGLTGKVGSLPLIDGIILHDALGCLLLGHPLPSVIAQARLDYAEAVAATPIKKNAEEEQFLLTEQTTLIEGILRAFTRHRLPALLEEYQVVAVEEEFTFPMDDNLQAMMRMDAILRRRDDGILHILDFKTLQYPSYDWARKWQHDDQWLLYLLAAEHHYQSFFGGVLIEGIVKGIYKQETSTKSPFHGQKIQHSPYCYGYWLRGQPSLYQSAYTSRKGYEKVKVGPGGIMSAQDWFEQVLLPEHAMGGGFNLNEQFVIVPTLHPTAREKQRWLTQQTHAELAWHAHMEDIRQADYCSLERQHMLDFHCPMNHGRCFKYGGDNTCQFEPLCFNETVEEDPLGSGLYDLRQPHHATEQFDPV